MIVYILRRLGGLLLSLAMLSVIVFALMHAVPGGPFSYEQNMPQYVMDNIAHKYGLDRPVYEQYLNWVGAMLQGDFGIPYQSPTETVVEVILRAWPVTLIIGGISIAFAFGVGMLLGTIAAFNQNSWIDNLVTFGGDARHGRPQLRHRVRPGHRPLDPAAAGCRPAAGASRST